MMRCCVWRKLDFLFCLEFLPYLVLVLFTIYSLTNMENNLYKVDKIEGKGVGCIALQDIKPGTLILKEVPQCVAKKELVYFSQEGMAVLL